MHMSKRVQGYILTSSFLMSLDPVVFLLFRMASMHPKKPQRQTILL